MITKGYNLPAKFVIHTVGPVYGRDDPKLLEDAYRSCLKLAEKHSLSSIAFPAISTGAYGYPFTKALEVVKAVMESFGFSSVKKVVLCFFSEGDYIEAKEFFGSL